MKIIHYLLLALSSVSAAICNTTSSPCNLACAIGQHCELNQVECIRAPCPPVPTCVDDQVAPVDPCAAPNLCGADELCKTSEVQCLIAPCPQVATCEKICKPDTCTKKEVCKVTQVQCLVAPCPPVAECVPKKRTSPPCTAKCHADQICKLHHNKPYCADVCSPTRCASNETCTLQAVNCLVAPCPPIATCTPNK